MTPQDQQRSIEIVEVAARDGLQNERVIVPTERKVQLITDSIDAGVRRLEVASFVHPGRVPQMADAEAVISALPDMLDVTYIGLVLNKRGYLRALETKQGGRRGIDEVGCVTVASDTFAQKNQGQTLWESVDVAKEIVRLANRDGLRAQVTISAACGCPFEGEVARGTIVDMAKSIADAGPVEIALADTIGVGVPGQVADLFAAVGDAVPGMRLRGHFHNTRNTGIANAWAAYTAGARVLDASVGGLGGCPFAPNATGNIGTDDLVYMLGRAGVETGVDLGKLIEIARGLEAVLGRPVPSMVSKAGGFPSGEDVCMA